MGADLRTPPEAMDAFSAKVQGITEPADRLDALAGMEAGAPFIVATELDALATELDQRGGARNQVADGDGGSECDGDCESTDCHTVSAVATWHRTAGILRRRASELRGEV